MLPAGPAPEHLVLASLSASDGSCSGLDPYAELYIRTAKLVRGIPIMTSILRPLAGASCSSSSTSTPNADSFGDYPEIKTSAYEEPAKGGRLILLVAPNGDQFHNNSSEYLTIGRSETSDAQTSSVRLDQNLNLDFNVVRVQAIMETIQRMSPNCSPLALLAQQGG
jgi:hypothetical protein